MSRSSSNGLAPRAADSAAVSQPDDGNGSGERTRASAVVECEHSENAHIRVDGKPAIAS
jgi:hypothetical protein